MPIPPRAPRWCAFYTGRFIQPPELRRTGIVQNRTRQDRVDTVVVRETRSRVGVCFSRASRTMRMNSWWGRPTTVLLAMALFSLSTGPTVPACTMLCGAAAAPPSVPSVQTAVEITISGSDAHARIVVPAFNAHRTNLFFNCWVTSHKPTLNVTAIVRWRRVDGHGVTLHQKFALSGEDFPTSPSEIGVGTAHARLMRVAPNTRCVMTALAVTTPFPSSASELGSQRGRSRSRRSCRDTHPSRFFTPSPCSALPPWRNAHTSSLSSCLVSLVARTQQNNNNNNNDDEQLSV